MWEKETGQSKVELAEESKLWAVHIDKGAFYTRTLDKYREAKSLPKNPRWRDIIRTAEFCIGRSKKEQLISLNLKALIREIKQYKESGIS